MNYSKDGLRVSHHEQKYFCSFCNFKTHKKYNLEVHEKNKHGTLQTGSGALLKEQTIPHHVQQQSLHQRSIQYDSHIEKQSNQQEENIDQLHENIDKWQKAYETLKLQYQQEEKVTTSDDGRPSHVSIQLYDDGVNYELLEKIKNGRTVAAKFDSKELKFKTPNTVAVFSNEKPDLSELSKDRWKIFRIRDDDLIDVTGIL